ncbi:hypothetical protein TNCT_580141 [Trichonephila clavata]|uniref:Uncharacterized protein n=1 Tax=Trichonephila clavata TaxID=2740835 RepID=A0A8X6H8L8_TRICU|nr:hypothetical protein TNCT_580141 [Trichonephila clavata]
MIIRSLPSDIGHWMFCANCCLEITLIDFKPGILFKKVLGLSFRVHFYASALIFHVFCAPQKAASPRVVLGDIFNGVVEGTIRRVLLRFVCATKELSMFSFVSPSQKEVQSSQTEF